MMRLGVAASTDPADFKRRDLIAWGERGAEQALSDAKRKVNFVRQLFSLPEKLPDEPDLFNLGPTLFYLSLFQAHSWLISAASLSLVLGLVNLLPVPLLDGGNVLICGIEYISNKPVNDRTKEISFKIGLVGAVIFFTLLQLRGLPQGY